ncbi:hypothetical protein [Vreelandella populi]|uniref:Uncharacterized protein n=1 Tax=Vreelandella populi TaxID=2498858 RepID=A0A433LGE2_9GAMM|nr:hypothetical protein [Halomonas populi]RUR37953.1 hypothetical protein ELY25_10885 [Halomonas populi]RUR48931.1 hypothetical protein ELY37_03540 [Halomonas populi]
MADIATAVRQLLTAAPDKALPMTYQQVAASMGLTPPGTIQRVTQALEQLMRDDAATHQPFIAALVVSRRGDNMPGAGFFELAVALGRFPADSTQHAKAYRAEYQQALALRSNT